MNDSIYTIEYAKKSGQLRSNNSPVNSHKLCEILKTGKHIQIVWVNVDRLVLITVEPLFDDWVVHRPPLPSISVKSFVADLIQELKRYGGTVSIRTDNYYHSQHS